MNELCGIFGSHGSRIDCIARGGKLRKSNLDSPLGQEPPRAHNSLDMIRHRLLLVLILCTIVTPIASSQTKSSGKHPPTAQTIWEPPVLDWPEDLPPPTVKKEMVRNLVVAGTPIMLEETKLDDAQKRLGGTIGHSGDAGDSLYWLCLGGSGKKGRWVLWLESSEVDGGRVGAFQWRLLGPGTRLDRRCQTLGKGDHRVALPLTVHFGMTETQVRSILGQPTARKGQTLIFDHEHEEVIDNLPFTSSNTVAVGFRGGVVWAIQVWRNTMN